MEQNENWRVAKITWSREINISVFKLTDPPHRKYVVLMLTMANVAAASGTQLEKGPLFPSVGQLARINQQLR